ncbi:MAG: hypothetical protein A2161_04670 [Candidatus Schekmanbacteria bacterium RBG_13_48_7]|uniref:EcsC family protein n=1 Tax=Candidatus Schekmanbacteria bacterium RBG_13_48_7 TaxID=1817878 RepID=A0A1F7RN77_9BACT|nr:MAG: hypothetical protein A2161_04670 [Candidatus Schekmanbacteria bacterium RBG_13_48_7]
MFTEYENKIIKEIAQHIIEPNPVQKVLSLAGKPVEKILNVFTTTNLPVLKKIPKLINRAVDKGVRLSIKAANIINIEKTIMVKAQKLTTIKSFNNIIELELAAKDTIADMFNVSNAVLLGTEGAVMGAAATLCEWIPGAQIIVPAVIAADVSSSLTFLTRHVCQITASYGYDPRNPENIPHILGAMIPQTDTSDEGYFSSKAMVAQSIRDSSKFLSRFTGIELEDKMLKGEAPILIKLLNYVSERLGIVITEKELGMLVPVAGALLNGGVNVAFQQTGHISAKDYFRQLYLDKKYGEITVRNALNDAIDTYKQKS